MDLEKSLRRAFLRRLVSTPEGRAHVLSLMVAAEEGDEAGVFDQLLRVVDEPKLRRTIARHQEDERVHAGLYRSCLTRNGLALSPVPDELMIIRQIARAAGGVFADGLAAGSAAGLDSDDAVMRTFALLLAIEERGVEQFPLIGAEFRRIGDHETAAIFDRVAKDELRHTKYCRAIGRRHAPDEQAWEASVAHHRAIEARAFAEVGRAGLAYVLRQGLLGGRFFRALARALAALDALRAPAAARSVAASA